MKSKMRFFLSLTVAVTAMTVAGQHVSFDTEDNLQRGFYDRPYLRYEAEPDLCELKGSFLLAPDRYSQSLLQVDASNSCAAALSQPGDYVAWTTDAPANAMTLRFSIPDSDDGKGLKTRLALTVDGRKIADIDLDSYWAWQWMSKSTSVTYHPDNTPASDKFARMRFDEVNILLPETIAAGSRLSLVRETASDYDITIDFIELETAEKIGFEDIDDENKVQYNGDGSTLQSFINDNAGKTIYIGPGTYNIGRRLILGSADTRIVGAGMWYTTLNFTASSDNNRTYSNRGIECNVAGCAVSDLSLTTVNNKRYYNNDESKQVGKGFMGSWGTGGRISRVRVDHFECGAWIADYSGTPSRDLTVEYCRFRNNYADGINLCTGTVGATVTHCSFRNNGDDDMASWSATHMAKDNEFSYCTAECNWRASSLGFFGGDGNRAHHIAIYDATDCGARVNCVFAGTGFGDNESMMTDMTIRRSGNTLRSDIGSFWGAYCGALQIDGGGNNYDLENLRIERVDIYNPRGQGVRIGSGNIRNLQLHDIHVDGGGVDALGIFCSPSAKGDGQYSNLTVENVKDPGITDFSKLRFFNFIESSGIDTPAMAKPFITGGDGCLSVDAIAPGTSVTIHDMSGSVKSRVMSTGRPMNLTGIHPGIYIVSITGCSPAKIIIR